MPERINLIFTLMQEGEGRWLAFLARAAGQLGNCTTKEAAPCPCGRARYTLPLLCSPRRTEGRTDSSSRLIRLVRYSSAPSVRPSAAITTTVWTNDLLNDRETHSLIPSPAARR